MALILALIPLVLIVVCFVKESKVTGLYKAFGVYGRLYGYLTTTFLMGACACWRAGSRPGSSTRGKSRGPGAWRFSCWRRQCASPSAS